MKSKLMLIMMVLTVAMFTASTAFATIELSSRSEEMMANATCDQAGSIELAFDAEDYETINDYLNSGNDYVRIRVTLTGTDIEPSATPPFLCKAISGTTDDVSVLPEISNEGDGYVALDEEDVEVSSYGTGPDVTAYVYGAEGNRYFDIYITDMEDPFGIVGDDIDDDDQVWIRVGLYNELIEVDEDEDDTAICVNVEDFSGLSKLTCSYNFNPTSLSINSSDNEIGHFLETVYDLRDLSGKGVDCTLWSDDSTIMINCETYTTPGGQNPEEGCAEFTEGATKYFVLEGDYPADGLFTLVVRTNGAADGDDTQSGVYISDIWLENVRGDSCTDEGTSYDDEDYYDADGEDADDWDGDGPCSWYNAEKVVVNGIQTDAISDHGNKLIIGVDYYVVESEVEVGDVVTLWVDAMTEPCGAMATGTVTGAEIVDCTVEYEDCMYFPYVLNGVSPWATGVVVSNMDAGFQKGPFSAASMNAVFTLVDSTGTAFEHEMSGFPSAVYSFMLDDLVSMAGWTPAAGNCVLYVDTDFVADGYSFLTNGAFGAGALPRLCCDDIDCCTNCSP